MDTVSIESRNFDC